MKKKLMINLIPAFLISLFIVACSSPTGEIEPVTTASPEATESIQSPDKPYSVVDGDTVWTLADEMPLFNGGDSALISYISKNISYPGAAVKTGTEGRCIVRFCVTGKGDVDKVSILKGVSPELDAEAIRVVASLPEFGYPGIKNGKPVSVWYVVPIQFKLK